MARKSMNVVDVMAWIRKTGEKLVGYRVANIYQINNIIIIKLKGNTTLMLALEGGKRIHITNRILPVESKLSPFSMILRKELRGQRLKSVSQINNDRIIRMTFSNELSLIVELLPRGTIVLSNNNDQIITSLTYLKTKDRVIKRGMKYEPPPSSGISLIEIDCKKISEGLKKQKDLVRGLIRGLGIPGEVAEEAIYRAGLDPKERAEDLDIEMLELLANKIREVIEDSFRNGGFLVYKDGTPVEASPFKPLRFSDKSEVKVKSYDTFDEALDDLFFYLQETSGLTEASKLMRSIEEAKERAEEYMNKAVSLRKLAEMIAQNYDTFDRIMRCAKESFETGGWRNVAKCPNVISVDPSTGKYIIEINDVKINLDIKENVDRLIIRLYTEAGEYDSKAKRALESLESLKDKLKELELKNKVKESENLVKLRKRKWYEKYHWIITRNGFLAIGGRNADQNESIVRKYLDEKDIFLHADIHGAPAVVIKTEGREPTLKDLMDAALIAATYSKAWKEGLGSVTVWWVRGSQVSKSPPSGEYLSKGAFMIYGKKNYLKPIQLKLALGVGLDEEGIPIILVGPEDLIKQRSLAYAILIPGNEKVSEIAKVLKEKLARVVSDEVKHLILSIQLKELEERLPGRARILYIRKGDLIS